MAHSPSFSDSCPYEPPVSLWRLVEQHVEPSEQPEVKYILGESLVDQSLELREEICTLLDIWREYRAETQQNVFHSRLPEPPAVRDRLKQEIIFFVENIHEKAKENMRNPDAILSKHNGQLLDYACGTPRPGSVSSRPSTARSSQDGRDTPMIAASPSMQRDKALQVEHFTEKLNAFNMDDIAQHLRETLEEEVEMLLHDIDFLQKCLDDEADYRSTTDGFEEPSLQDLREARSKLEKEWLSSDAVLTGGPKKDTKVVQDSKRLVQRKGSAGLLRSAQSSAGSVRTGPVKASHNLSQPLTTPVPPPPKPDSAHNMRRKSSISKLHNKDTFGGCTASVNKESMGDASKSPVPRPSSAQRFRKMVQECRDGT